MIKVSVIFTISQLSCNFLVIQLRASFSLQLEMATWIRSSWFFKVSLWILTVPWSRWFRLLSWYHVTSFSFLGSWELFQVLQLRLVSLSSLCFTISSDLLQGPGLWPAFRFLLFFPLWSATFSLPESWNCNWYYCHFHVL